MLTKMKNKIKEMPFKKAYYFMLIVLIIVPVQGVLLTALLSLNKQIRQGAIENIQQSQQAVIADVMSDVENLSTRMSIVVNSGYANSLRFLEGEQEYGEWLRDNDIWYMGQDDRMISLSFYLKNGEVLGFKNYIDIPAGGIREVEALPWYDKTLKSRGKITIGSLLALKDNDFVNGSEKGRLILAAAVAPSEKLYQGSDIEMIVLYQYSKADQRVQENNAAYLDGDNRLGMTQITDGAGNCVYATPGYFNSGVSSSYVCVKTPFEIFETTWYVENYIEKSKMMEDYWKVVIIAMCVAAAILILVIYFSKFLLKGILNPIEAVSWGLHELEEGNLDISIEPAGQFEIRSMIHQFNGMAGQLRILMQDYERKGKQDMTQDYFGKMIKGELAPEDVCREAPVFFEEPYTIIGMFQQLGGEQGNKAGTGVEMFRRFSLNPRYASRCLTYLDSSSVIFLFYRITEINYQAKLTRMVREIQKTAEEEFKVSLFVCLGKKMTGQENFSKCLTEVKNGLSLRHLADYNTIVDLTNEGDRMEAIVSGAERHKGLANALYIADEKNVNKKRDELLNSFNKSTLQQARTEVLSVILAVAERFEKENGNFIDVFGQKYNYIRKLEKIQDNRSMRMWLTNYLMFIVQYTEKS